MPTNDGTFQFDLQNPFDSLDLDIDYDSIFGKAVDTISGTSDVVLQYSSDVYGAYAPYFENYLNGVRWMSEHFSVEPLIQYAEGYVEYVTENGTRDIVETYEPIIHIAQDYYDDLKEEAENIIELSGDTVDGLVHLTNDTIEHALGNLNYSISESNLLENAKKTYGTVVNNTIEFMDEAVQRGEDIRNAIEKQEKYVRDVTPTPPKVYEPPTEETIKSIIPKKDPIVEEQRIEQDTMNIVGVQKELKTKQINRFHETYLDPIQAQEKNEKIDVGTVLDIPDHFRGDASLDDRHTYRENNEYTDEDYQYINSAKDATRSRYIGMEGELRATRADHEQYKVPDLHGSAQLINDNYQDKPEEALNPRKAKNELWQSDGLRKFEGSHTATYGSGEPRRAYMQTNGLAAHEKKYYPNDDGNERPLSVLDPFYRLRDPEDARQSNLYLYNRTHHLVSDLEWRKGFRHVFITRPECYIMTKEKELCSQCYNDEMFYSSYLRMPYISYLLSPSYITCTDKNDWRYGDNFNYLLSNRVLGLSVEGTEMDQVTTVQKATSGATVTPGSWVNNDYGNTLNLTFRDTKNLEVYECLRLWMRYIANIYGGSFASAYDPSYPYENTYDVFSNGSNSPTDISSIQHLHPYDRALDYCATIFDIVTNESGTKILYWCKYIGVYPRSATPGGLSTSTQDALTAEQSVSSAFYYQGKVECVNKSLVEFNYNAGIVDNMGHVIENNQSFSIPFLLRNNYITDIKQRNDNYLGPAGMFTGRPYIVLNAEPDRYLKRNRIIPQLRFATPYNDKNGELNGRFNTLATTMNAGLDQTVSEADRGTEVKVAIYD